MIASIDHYNYQVTWSEEDNAYIGCCLEFPSVSWVGESKEGALAGIRAVTLEYIRYLNSNGEATSPKSPEEELLNRG